MTTYGATITGLTQGDPWKITRTVTEVPVDDAIADGYFTVKAYPGAADADALLQKHITPVDVVNVGQVTDTGANGDTTGALRFELTSGETQELTADAVYWYDIQIVTAAGYRYTLEEGRLVARRPIRAATP